MQRFGLSGAFVALVLAGALFVPAAGSQTRAPFRSSVSPISAAV
jgi:hypothetical protein